MDRVIVGLGNPGDKYANTRHNAGFMVLDYIANKNKLSWQSATKFNSLTASIDGFLLLKPQTFMNDSGSAVSKFLNFHKLNPGALIVIHDEVDLPFGTIKKQ